MLTVGPDVSLESARSPLGPNCADHQLKWQQCAPYFPMDVGQSLQFLEATDEAMPDADPVTAAQVTVTCTSRSDLGGGAVERDMEVRFQESGGSRIQEEDAVFAIKHYQYCAWPDHGVPSDTLVRKEGSDCNSLYLLGQCTLLSPSVILLFFQA